MSNIYVRYKNSIEYMLFTCVFCVGICNVNAKLFASKLSSRAISAPCTPDSKRLFPYSCENRHKYKFFFFTNDCSIGKLFDQPSNQWTVPIL